MFTKIYILYFLLIINSAFAEQDLKELDLKGLDPDKITEKLGKADKVNSISKSQFQWIYGQSIVFFQDNAVIAWSDNGDLSSRENLAKIRNNSGNEEMLINWKNPWTPIESENPSVVIEDLIQKAN